MKAKLIGEKSEVRELFVGKARLEICRKWIKIYYTKNMEMQLIHFHTKIPITQMPMANKSNITIKIVV